MPYLWGMVALSSLGVLMYLQDTLGEPGNVEIVELKGPIHPLKVIFLFLFYEG